MAGAARPMETDDERLWLLGLVLVVGLPVAAFVLFGSHVPGTVEPVEFHVADDRELSGVDVRIDRVDLDDGESRTVQRRHLQAGTDVAVFSTHTAGAYEVTIAEGRDACRRVVRVRREGRRLESQVRRPADSGGECPVSFSLQ